jgi:hypothetical protein
MVEKTEELIRADHYLRNNPNPNCKWMWVRLPNKFKTRHEAKAYLHDIDNVNSLFEKYTIICNEY